MVVDSMSSPKFEDFWKKRDAEGNYLRPIGAYRPTYGAFLLKTSSNLKI